MANKKLRSYWLVLMAMLMTVNTVFSVQPTQAHYASTAVWNTMIEPEDDAVASNCLVDASGAPLTILLGEIAKKRSPVSFTLESAVDVTGRLTWGVDKPELLTVKMSVDGETLAQKAKIKLKAGTTKTVIMTLSLTEEALTTVHDEMEVNITVNWNKTLTGTFLAKLPAVTEEDIPETEPAPTEVTEPAPTEGGETEPTTVPTEGNEETTTPTEGNEETTPATEGNKETTAPTEDNKETTAPTEGNKETTETTENSETGTETTAAAENNEESASVDETQPKTVAEAALAETEGAEQSEPVSGQTEDGASAPQPDPESITTSAVKLPIYPSAVSHLAFKTVYTPKLAAALTAEIVSEIAEEISATISTTEPTAAPTTEPTAAPIAETTAAPTTEPTAAPTTEPTAAPTTEPTAAPTTEPTAAPTTEPTAAPTTEPTAAPTTEPTAAPTTEPTAAPTTEPTTAPTTEPTTEPATEPATDPSEPTEDEENHLDAIPNVAPDGKLPLKLFLKNGPEKVSLGMGVVTDAGTQVQVFPAFTRYSLDNGESYYMLYHADKIVIESQGNTELPVLMDLSRADLGESTSIVLAAEVDEQKLLLRSESISLLPTEDALYEIDARVLTQKSPVEIALGESWKNYTFEYSVQMLSADTEDGLPAYIDVDLSTWSATDFDEETGVLTLKIGKKLPLAGTYRVQMEWSYEGICFAEEQTTFFINYSAYSENEGTGGAGQ